MEKTEPLDPKVQAELDKLSEEEILTLMMNSAYNLSRSNDLEQYLKENYDGLSSPREEDKSYRIPRKPQLQLIENNKDKT